MYSIRYTPGSHLAARWPDPAGDFPTREAAEDIRRQCVNATHMEVVAR